MDVDVVHPLVVELLLHVRDGGVVSRDPVDARVLQPPLLHQLAAHLHNQRHELERRERQEMDFYNGENESFTVVGQERDRKDYFFPPRTSFCCFVTNEIGTDPAVLCRRTVVQPHSKRDSRRWLLLEGFPHQPRDAFPPRPFVLRRAGVIFRLTFNISDVKFFFLQSTWDFVSFAYLCACFSSPAQVWVSADLLLWSLLFLPAGYA